MTRRKGEMSTFQIDNGWPYQVALPEAVSLGKANDVVRDFCKDLSLCPRGHTFRRDDEWINVWCFAEEADALRFIARFGGEMIAVEDRPRWPGKVRRR
jgi:hypothetical protein